MLGFQKKWYSNWQVDSFKWKILGQYWFSAIDFVKYTLRLRQKMLIFGPSYFLIKLLNIPAPHPLHQIQQLLKDIVVYIYKFMFIYVLHASPNYPIFLSKSIGRGSCYPLDIATHFGGLEVRKTPLHCYNVLKAFEIFIQDSNGRRWHLYFETKSWIFFLAQYTFFSSWDEFLLPYTARGGSTTDLLQHELLKD